MTNQGKNKYRNHINTDAFFNFIHNMSNLIKWDGKNGKMDHFCIIFLNEIPFKEIMANRSKSKNKKHINTGASFFFVHYIANMFIHCIDNLLGWGGAK